MAEKELTIEKAMADFKKAYAARRKLIEREREDFLFALGNQWSAEDVKTLEDAGIKKPITDNRIAPNIFLLTGLERQNRTEFRAFPEGEEDSLKAEIASALFKNAIKQSDYDFKSSEQFKDGITCGESHLELYIDNTYNLINGKPCWKKVDGNCIFPEPGFREYDFSDARYVNKVSFDLSEDDLISLYPEKEKKIKESEGGRLDLSFLNSSETHRQPKDYGKDGESSDGEEKQGFDLVERYYKKWVPKIFVGDKETGEIKEADDEEKADAFVMSYKTGIAQEQRDFEMQAMQAQQAKMMGQPVVPPLPPKQRDPDRFKKMKQSIPEIWVFAFVPGMAEPLANERAWFYPLWKSYPFVPFFCRFSTAPITGDDSHLLIQGVVHGVKGVQEKHNKAEMLLIRHLNSTTNSGWLAQEDSWVDRESVKNFGSSPGVNLEYKKGSDKPERIYPSPLSQGHAVLSNESAEAIKAQLGINADLLAVQEGSSQSGRAIALRQRQGMIMIQEPFDNKARSNKIAGRFILTQLSKIYDTESAKKILGDAFLKKNFPPLMLKQVDPVTGAITEQPMTDETGQPMAFDSEMATLVIGEVLAGDLEKYDVSVGEAVASETMKLANSAEVKEIAQTYPGLIPPDILIEESQLPSATKNKILSSIKQAQMAQMAPPMMGGAPMPNAGMGA